MDYSINENGLYLPKDYQIYVKPNLYDLTTRQMELYKQWSDFTQWGRRNPVLFAERIYGVEFMDYQRYIFMMSWNTPYVVWCCSRNSGKALDLDTNIPTPFGDKTMSNIQVGDYVYDEYERPTRVIATSPIFYGHKCYRITFSDGEVIVADADHLWTVKTAWYNNITVSTRALYTGYGGLKDKDPRVKRQYYVSVPTVTGGYKEIVSIEETTSRPTKCITVDSPSHLYLCGNKKTVTHNSILGSMFIMTKTLLIPNHTSYILCGVGSQSIELFSKIEKFVYNQIPSFKTLTDVYQGELVKSQANNNGFVHNPASYRYSVFNGSQVFTLNGAYDNNRSDAVWNNVCCDRQKCLLVKRGRKRES